MAVSRGWWIKNVFFFFLSFFFSFFFFFLFSLCFFLVNMFASFSEILVSYKQKLH